MYIYSVNVRKDNFFKNYFLPYSRIFWYIKKKYSFFQQIKIIVKIDLNTFLNIRFCKIEKKISRIHNIDIQVVVHLSAYLYEYIKQSTSNWFNSFKDCSFKSYILLLILFFTGFHSLVGLAVEYTDCISAEGKIPTTTTNECPRYDTRQYDGQALVMLDLWEMQSTPL